jgi:O-antigen/teichoic acid export membrane protein
MAFLALPVLLTTWSKGITSSSDIAVAITIMNMIVYVFAIADMVILPKVSNYLSTNRTIALYQMLSKSLKLSLMLLVMLVLFLELFTPNILRILIGEKLSPEGILATRLLLLAALPLALFMEFRGVIDAKYAKALNSLYLSISVLIYLLCAGLVSRYSGNLAYLLLTFVGTSYFLGGLILRELILLIKISKPLTKSS